MFIVLFNNSCRTVVVTVCWFMVAIGYDVIYIYVPLAEGNYCRFNSCTEHFHKDRYVMSENSFWLQSSGNVAGLFKSIFWKFNLG